MELKTKIDDVLDSFHKKIENIIYKLNDRWNKRESLDVFELALDVLYFRNTDVFNTINILLRNNQINGAELLLRPLFEGIIIFEWCLIDKEIRVLRFRRTSFEGMINLLENGYLKKEKYNLNTYKEALDYLITNGFKNLPNMRQMLDEVDSFNRDYSYKFYSHLSKITHGVFENWGDFLNFKNDLQVQENKLLFTNRFYACFALTLFLQMRNIINFTKFDTYMFVDELNILEEYYSFNVYPILKQYGL